MLVRRAVLPALALALTSSVLPASAAPSVGATTSAADPAIETGTALPVRLRTGLTGPVYLPGVSDDLVVSPSVGADGSVAVLSATDGHGVMRAPAAGPFVVSTYVTVSGPFVVEKRLDAVTNLPHAVSVIDTRDGSSATTTIPDGDRWLWSDGSRTLTFRPGGTLHLLTADGQDVSLPGTYGGLSVTDHDDHTVLLSDGHLVDLSTGTVSTGLTGTLSPVLGRTRLFGLTTDANDRHLVWQDRVGGGTGSVAVPGATRLVPFADGVAAVVPAATPCAIACLDVRPVELGTGALGNPVLTQVAQVNAAPAGGLVAVADDAADGHVVMLDRDGAERTRIDLEPAADRADTVSLLGGDVMTVWDDQRRESGYAPLLRTPADGSGAWTAVTDDSGDVPADVLVAGTRREVLQRAGEVSLWAPSVSGQPAPSTSRLTWPGGGRTLSVPGNQSVLGHGGELVSSWTSSAGWVVEDVRSGETVLTTGASRAVPDGRWVWTVGTYGALTGVDTTGVGATQHTPSVSGCSAATLTDVRGRWALLTCNAGNVVVDLTGAQLPWWPGGPYWRLGGGFVARVRHGAGDVPPVVQVADFSAAHTTHLYGPALDPVSQGQVGQGVFPDEDGGPALAYFDPRRQVRTADLDWLGAPPALPADRTAPRETSQGGTAAVVRGTGSSVPVTLHWSFEDPAGPGEQPPSGLASYDVRRLDGSGDQSWYEPGELHAITATSVTVHVPYASRTCLAVRGRDVNGNVSDWSPARCTVVDNSAPDPGVPAAGPRVRTAVTNQDVTLRYRGNDSSGIGSYDVEYRLAGPGHLLGPWVAPSPWQRTTRTSVTRTVAPGAEVCFRERARDVAGNTGIWSAPRCATVPVDDTALVRRSGTVSRVVRRGALGGTVRRLRGQGTEVLLRHQPGTSAGVRVWCGPGQGVLSLREGAVDSTVGMRDLSRCGTGFRTLILDRSPRRASSWVLRVDRGTVLVDAVGVLRAPR